MYSHCDNGDGAVFIKEKNNNSQKLSFIRFFCHRSVKVLLFGGYVEYVGYECMMGMNVMFLLYFMYFKKDRMAPTCSHWKPFRLVPIPFHQLFHLSLSVNSPGY